ncbi:MAG: prolyl oligopeptidase family serine peptidase [Pseudomonadota bacterium]
MTLRYTIAIIYIVITASISAAFANGLGEPVKIETEVDTPHTQTAEAERKTMTSAPDPFLWLEEIEGKRALEWVEQQNAQSKMALTSDPLFDTFYEEARTILTSEARIPYGSIKAGKVYNLWKDKENKRGLWRRTNLKAFANGKPNWETVLDYDALAKKEGRNWIAGGIKCLSPDYRHCMIELSDGGKDAGEWREFDTVTKEFVENGFFLREAKSSVSWENKDTLLVATDRGPGTLNTSGYPRTAIEWQRGTNIDDAKVILESAETDVFAYAFAEQDENTTWVFRLVAPSFFEKRLSVQREDGQFKPLPFPPNIDFQGVINGSAIISLREAWTYGGRSYDLGTVIAYDLQKDTASLVWKAKKNQSIEAIGVGKTGLILQYLEDVVGKAARLRKDTVSGSWLSDEIDLPDNGVVSLVSMNSESDSALISFESLTRPDTLYFVDNNNRKQTIASLPNFYDASDVTVEQRFAKSADGTKVPYFVAGKKDVLKDGDAPTIQYGYGGFLAAILPTYYSEAGRPQNGALAGKLWIERGGVLVIANIRGGSEYGPAWHQAALKENRQRAYDDFIAVSEDLIETGVSRPEMLGIIGRSNGGLLMGVMLTQRPDLYAAIDIGVPLFDMKRYNKLLAGASWIGEYGNPDDPKEWAYISQYSPYQNLRAGADYPSVLIYTSTKDDRVHPGHARKAAAKLASLGYSFYYYENTEGGHGGTANQDQLAYLTALEFAYFAKRLMGEEE